MVDITKFVKTPAGGCLSAPLGGVYRRRWGVFMFLYLGENIRNFAPL